MAFTAKVKRIGGSTYLLVPPDVARDLELQPDGTVEAEVHRTHATLDEVLDAVYGLDPDAEYVDRDELWGDYGKRFLE